MLPLGFGVASGQVVQNETMQRLIGTWRLVSIVNEKGHVPDDRGQRPTGLIFYDASGNMAVQIMPDRDRPRFSRGKATPEEAMAALIGYTAYFGTYSVDDSMATVTHHRQGNITGLFGEFVRRYEFVGNDKLILQSLETKDRLVWERVK